MNKSDNLFKVASALIFCAMVAYMVVYIVHRVSEPVQTAHVVTSTMRDSSAISGLVVRNERIIDNDAPFVNIVVSDGEKISFGQTVAIVYDSEEAMQRASALSSLEAEIEEVEAALSPASASVGVVQSREQSVNDAIINLSASIRNNSFVGVDACQSTLTGLVFQNEKANATEEYLAELRTEYALLSETAAGDTEEIAVNENGTYSAIVDGYEGIKPDFVQGLSPSELRELISADRTLNTNAIGKLLLSFKWYYAAIVPREDASRLVAGRTVNLSFGRYYSDTVSAEVVYVGQAEGDKQLILFSMDRGFSEMMAVRAVSAEIIYSEYTGLRVPVSSLYRYYAGRLSADDADLLSEGETVSLSVGGASYQAFVSDIGSEQRTGELPTGVEADSAEDTRPLVKTVVFCWPYSPEEDAPYFLGEGALVTTESGLVLPTANYYAYNEDIDRMCVFAMTGLQAERKKVSLVYAGEDYALVTSEGSDALREGNDVITSTAGLFNGRVYR